MGTTIDLLTLEDFIARPEREDGQTEELIEGELFVSPTAKGKHTAIVRNLRESLKNLEQQGYVLSNDFSCILGRSMLTPDLFVVRQDRWQSAVDRDYWLEGAPELVIEVASPSNRKLALKADIYLEHGAEQVWVVNPKALAVTVFTADSIHEKRSGETLEFHDVRVQVDSLFVRTATHLLALEDFLVRPKRDDGQTEELIEGELFLSPARKVSHAAIVNRLRVSLAMLEQSDYLVANGFGCIFGRSMLSPDLAAVRRDCGQSAAENDDWLRSAPELVIEVASPGDRKLFSKAELYLEHGAEQVWIVYPRTQTVTVITPESTTEARMGETVNFHGVTLAIDSIFPSTKPK